MWPAQNQIEAQYQSGYLACAYYGVQEYGAVHLEPWSTIAGLDYDHDPDIYEGH